MRWHLLHIDNHHCPNNLYKELGPCNFDHSYQVYGWWSSFPTTFQINRWFSIASNSHVFFCLNNSLGNKWFDFKIPSWSVYTIDHTFSNMLSDMIFEAHCARILSCFRPKVGTWLTTQLIILAFQFFFHIISNLIRNSSSFNCRYHLVCVHTSHWPYGYSPFAFMATNTWVLMTRFMTPFPPLCEMLTSMCNENNYMQFLHPHSILFINELTLCSQKWHLHLSQCWPNTSGFTSSILCTSKICWF